MRGPANRLHAGRAFLTDFTVLQVSPSRTVQTFVLKVRGRQPHSSGR